MERAGVGTPDPRQIRVAWLSTLPMTDPDERFDFPTPPLAPVQHDDTGTTDKTMSRGAVAITVMPPGGKPIRMVTAHLKSKLLTFPDGTSPRVTPHDEAERGRYAAYALDRRAAEAATLRTWATQILETNGGPPLLACGDLNDTVQAATTQLLLGPPGSEIGSRG